MTQFASQMTRVLQTICWEVTNHLRMIRIGVCFRCNSTALLGFEFFFRNPRVTLPNIGHHVGCGMLNRTSAGGNRNNGESAISIAFCLCGQQTRKMPVAIILRQVQQPNNTVGSQHSYSAGHPTHNARALVGPCCFFFGGGHNICPSLWDPALLVGKSQWGHHQTLVAPCTWGGWQGDTDPRVGGQMGGTPPPTPFGAEHMAPTNPAAVPVPRHMCPQGQCSAPPMSGTPPFCKQMVQ